MKRNPVENLLQISAPLPPAQPSVVERARHRALVAFRNAEPVAAKPRPGFAKWAIAAAVIAIAAFVFLNNNNPSPDTARLFGELETLFPGQLAAVVINNGEVSLVLSEQPVERPADQRLEIPLPGDVVVLAYSGVSIETSGRQVTALLSGDGDAFAVDAGGNIYRGHRL